MAAISLGMIEATSLIALPESNPLRIIAANWMTSQSIGFNGLMTAINGWLTNHAGALNRDRSAPAL